METHDKPVDRWNLACNQFVDLFNRFLRRGSARHIGLIGDHDQDEAAVLQSLQLFAKAWVNFDILGPCRRKRLSVTYHGTIQHAVAVQKDCPRFHLTGIAVPTADSHLVWFAFSFGCDTNRCQTTAWNA